MKRTTREKRKACWAQRSNSGQAPAERECPGQGETAIVDPGSNMQAGLDHQQPDSCNEGPKTKMTDFSCSIFVSLKTGQKRLSEATGRNGVRR